MSDNKNPENNYDSLKDVREFQDNMFNPGHYIGTGRVSPVVSAPGNAMPMAIAYFLGAALFMAFGLFLFFSDIKVTSMGVIESELTNKIIALVIMVGISLFLLMMGFGYLKKAKKYHKEKNAIEGEEVEELFEDQIWQRTCPECGQTHDLDYPKCPNCKHNYLE